MQVLRFCGPTTGDPYACATFRHQFPGVTLFEKDIRELSADRDHLPPVDVLTGGFPCQSFSQAGGRRGFDDRRGQSFFDVCRLIAELESRHHRPHLIVLENVPHLLYGADGEWFDRVRRALRGAGYWFRSESCWIVNVKDATDVPQDRERLFMVAASREHFSYNPFTPPGTISLHRGPLQSLDIMLDRGTRANDCTAPGFLDTSLGYAAWRSSYSSRASSGVR